MNFSLRSLIIFTLVLTLSGCVDLGFENPQPKGGKPLDQVPAFLEGKWQMDDRLLTVSDSRLYYKSDTTSLVPSDSLVINAWNDFIFINFLDKSKDYWTLVVVRQKGEDMELFLPYLDSRDEKKLIRKYDAVVHNTKSNPQENKINKAYIINPTEKEWKKLLKSSVFEKVQVSRAE